MTTSNIWFVALFFFFFFFCDHPSLTVHVHKLERGVKRVPLLWSRSWSRWGFGTSVNVCPDNISDRLNLVWWCITMSQSIIREYYFAIFTVIAKIVSARFSEILQRLQFKLVWWYIITRRGKTPEKHFIAVTHGVRQRMWLGWLWTRSLPLLAVLIFQAWVSTGPNQ